MVGTIDILKSHRPAVSELFGIRDGYHGRQFFPETRGRVGGGLRMIEARDIYCPLYF